MLLPGAIVASRYVPRQAGSAHDLLHRVVREHLSTLVADAEARDRPLPAYVVQELEGYLGCGRPEAGFTWYRCPQCEHSLVLPFSCKGRAFCPSCGGRRMNQLAANLVDHVLPHVPVRQWVLTFPMPVRFWLAWRPKLRREVLSAVLRVVFDHYRQTLGEPGGQGGSVSIWQMAGSSVNLNPHIHALVLDGVYVWDELHGQPVFRCASRPGRQAMARLVGRMRREVLAVLDRHGLLDDPVEPEDETVQLELVEAALTQRVATGERRGRRIGRHRGAEPREPQASPRRCHAWQEYFDLHAGIRIAASDRKGLERLARYIARPPISQKRLSELPDGRVALALKRPWDDGTTHFVFRPLELLERLAALVPPPRHNLVVYHGVLAPRHRWRSQVVPPREGEPAEGTAAEPARRPRRSGWIPWSVLIFRTFGVDPLRCHWCQTTMGVRAIVRSWETSRKLLAVLGRPWQPDQLVPRPALVPWEEEAAFW